MRKRVLDKVSDEEMRELSRLYALPRAPLSGAPELANCRDIEFFTDMRIAFAQGFGKLESLADMSCGDGTIPRAVAEASGIEPLLGDVQPGHQFQGTYQETLPQLPVVDLFICSETIEHLDDPDADLALIREHCRDLFVTTPIDEPADYAPGHYWVWGREDVEKMLQTAGFEVSAFVEFDLTPFWYTHCKFGFWGCR